MEVRIGVIHANRELTVDTGMSVEDIEGAVSKALDGTGGVLKLIDDRGRSIHVPGDKLAYVEVISEHGRRVGFGG